MSSADSGQRPWLHVAAALVALCAFFGLVYYPYSPDQWPTRALTGYCEWLAHGTGWMLRQIGESLSVHGDTIHGRFNLKVILSCGALDVWAMLSAAIIATPRSLQQKLIGLAVGTAAILFANLVRLSALFLIGAKDIDTFHVFHEDVFSFVFVAYTLALYWLWLRWSQKGTIASA